MDALSFLKTHRYVDAINAYRVQLQAEPSDWSAVAGLARALQAAGQYAEALPLFRQSDEHEQKRMPGAPGCKEDTSCVLWCLGQHEQAKELMRGLVAGILDGSIKYADLAGGVQQGALLYYMGVTTQDKEIAEYALTYLRKLSRKSRIKYWPGPVARYLLGELEVENLLKEASAHPTLSEACQVAKENILIRRQLCVALFHIATRCRAQGLEAECLDWMRHCVALANPLVEPEWYLAREETQ